VKQRNRRTHARNKGAAPLSPAPPNPRRTCLHFDATANCGFYSNLGRRHLLIGLGLARGFKTTTLREPALELDRIAGPTQEKS